jgi:hypothetical protein
MVPMKISIEHEYCSEKLLLLPALAVTTLEKTLADNFCSKYKDFAYIVSLFIALLFFTLSTHKRSTHMHKSNVTFAEFLNPCIGMTLLDSSFTLEQLSEDASDYFQAMALKNHFSFLEHTLPSTHINLPDAP